MAVNQYANVASHHSTSSTRLTWILGALSVFAPFSTDMYLSGFSAIAKDLNTDIASVQLTLSTFFIGLAVGQLFYGPLIDRFGRRTPLLWGIALFVVSSALIVLAPNIEVFIGLRLLQAIGGCSGMIISRAIIQDRFAEREAAKALSLMMVIQTVGPITAPVIGAYLLVLGGWQAVFYFLLVFGLLCWWLTRQSVAESLPAHARQKPGIHATLTVFKRFLTQRRFIAPTIAGSLSNAVMFCFISGSPFVLMELYGLGQQAYGWVFSATALGMVATSQANRILLKRFKPRLLFNASIVVSLVAALCLVLLSGSERLWLFMIPLAICVAMVPVVCANSMALAMAESGPDAGSASSLIGVMQFALAGIVSALVGAFHNGTSMPMCATILACTLLAFVVNRFGR